MLVLVHNILFKSLCEGLWTLLFQGLHELIYLFYFLIISLLVALILRHRLNFGKYFIPENFWFINRTSLVVDRRKNRIFVSKIKVLVAFSNRIAFQYSHYRLFLHHLHFFAVHRFHGFGFFISANELHSFEAYWCILVLWAFSYQIIRGLHALNKFLDWLKCLH